MFLWLDTWFWIPIIYFCSGKYCNYQSMLGTSSSGSGLVVHSTHWSTLWVLHTYSGDFIQVSSQSYYNQITDILVFIPMSGNASSSGTPMAFTTATDISGSQALWMFPVLPCFVVPPVNLNGGIIPTKKCLSVSKTFCVNSNTVWRSFTVFFGAGCAEKYLSVDTFYTSLSIHYSMALLYR